VRKEIIMEQRAVNPWSWQDNFGFSQAVELSGHQRVLVCSGQTSVDENGTPLHAGDIGAQSLKALDNLEAVLKQAGLGLANVVRLNLYVTDINALFPVYGGLVARMAAAGCKPASTLLEVQRLAFPGLMIEIEATAVAWG
jgi:enamine deaminase RidA (YjgF/YER057c/UK114 family)